MASVLEPQISSSETDTLIPARPKPLANFQRLSADVSLYTPPSSAPPPASNAPTTILFCAWMNAAVKHIDYYTRTYIALYPGTRIIVVRISTKQFMFQSEVSRRKEVKTAVDAILAAEAERGENERLVIHAISNGGAKRTYGVAGLYKTRTGKPIPAKAFICDSAPGIPQFRRDMHALMLPHRHFTLLLWLPIYLLTLVSVSAVYVSVNWLPQTFWAELVWKPTRCCNEPSYMAKEMVKGYVYSKEDLSIDYKNVEEHARMAEKNGYRVAKKLIEGAAHAQMWKGKGGEEDYWGWVRGIWEMGFGLR